MDISQQINDKSFRQLNETLAQLGITGLSGEGLAELEKIWQEFTAQGWAANANKISLLLEHIGSRYYPLAAEGPGRVYPLMPSLRTSAVHTAGF